MTLNLILYLLFWAAFALGSGIVFKLAAVMLSILDKELPSGCPPQLRRLTWMLAAIWSLSMFAQGINLSRPYITAALQ